jgi:hypothetical protein
VDGTLGKVRLQCNPEASSNSSIMAKQVGILSFVGCRNITTSSTYIEVRCRKLPATRPESTTHIKVIIWVTFFSSRRHMHAWVI